MFNKNEDKEIIDSNTNPAKPNFFQRFKNNIMVDKHHQIINNFFEKLS